MFCSLRELKSLLWILIVSCALAEEERTILDVQLNPLVRLIKTNFGNAIQRTVRTRQNKQLLHKTNRSQEAIPAPAQFPCDLKNVKIRSDSIPNSVHELRPGDIDIIGAMGDSLTAGTGISSTSPLHEIFSDERGRSWSIGGEATWRTFLTLPNILKEFNPKLIGYSLNGSQSFQWASQFNVAENGAISKNIPFMVKELVKRIKNDPRLDFKQQWKMITLMIGDNDFCSELCFYSKPQDLVNAHRKHVLYVLRYLRDNLPRTIVNVVPAPRTSLLGTLNKDTFPECYLLHSFLCPCVAGLSHRNKQKLLEQVMIKWQLVDVEVANLPEFDLDDFTVIPHRFTLNYTFPTLDGGNVPDFGILAPDCFHFSERGQGRIANDLWNSLLAPFGKKANDGTATFSKFHCPSDENPYIFTRRNSR